ncbi:RagB/SusD family nutrient uptake outer membrane protein [Abyssalbus ytuae]|uniref:RagB/SusD family nutrient uptake outer membrane protein n=1 Tax=Abyssalbus ytuae TaxID=2926907 RepID=A0A9E6ZX54_9FLAO|nr:RagB/SusD family nutrient uptake outer membrane protein [Abyssalbus ytuae]UOB18451.1 RagB/SusD family nutrient uptake outer membrane protein [Abyssalbus ytuae]
MKKIIMTLLVLLALSCNDDFFDQVPDDRLTFEETFSKKTTVEMYLTAVYNHVPSNFDQRYSASNSVPATGGSDEGEYVWSFHLGNYFNIGDWNPTTGHVNTLWSNFYQAIRSASTFMLNVNKCQDCTPTDIEKFTAEARVLRAFYYYNLIRLYGPVLIMPETPVEADADLDALGLRRNTLDECVNYIISELDKGIEVLSKYTQGKDEIGRMDDPFAMAIKEKTLLFYASPLFNGNSDYATLVNAEGEPLIPQNYDVNKWKMAADVAKEFINTYVPHTFDLYKEYDENGTYDPYLSCRNVMFENLNEEMIFARLRGGNSHFYECTPYHLGYPSEVRGGGGLSPTQEMVDAYFMANGRSIDDPLSGYQETGFKDYQAPFDFESRSTFNQWVGREPRFYVGITYNNSLWIDRTYGDVITTTWYAGNSGKQAGANDYPPTGYIIRKFLPPQHWKDAQGSTNIPYLRLAEIYLDYAEALNEYDPGNPDILKYLNLIRERAGIAEYGEDLPVPSGQEEMREAIWKERRVELAFESVRYFDVRRWKIAEEVLAGPFHSMDINAKEEENFYNKIVFEQRIFSKNHYLWPIPQDELNSNPELIQNTGW